MRDTVNMTRKGVPAVGLVQTPFEKLARTHAKQLGMPDIVLLIYKQDLPSTDTPTDVSAKAEDVVHRMSDLLVESSRLSTLR